MRSTGITRKVDELGRVVIPIEIRRSLDIAERDTMEIYVSDDTIVLRKHKPTCVFCDDDRNITEFRGKNICAACLSALRNK